MCTTCGCGHGDTRIDGVAAATREHEHGHPHVHSTEHADGPVYRHVHADDTGHGHAHDFRHAIGHRHADGTWHSHGGALGAVHAAGTPPERIIEVERDILAKNDAFAGVNRQAFADRGIFALNLVSSPGSGKTTLLVKTIDALRDRLRVAVIEGDQQTSLDADRIRATGATAVQINTGKGCHLDARMVGQAFASLGPAADGLLLIENVGNLVCPAAFDLGEAHKVVILSVTEGEDKPLKYPDMFHAADLLVVNKIDLLPYVQFDMDKAIEYARRVRPGLPVLRVSAMTGEGLAAWLEWLDDGVARARARRDESVAGLRSRVLALESELARRTTPA